MTQRSTSSEARRAPTVRQREVLGRVGETFSLAELSTSACHRYEGHTLRMAQAMIERGAIEALGEGRYRKTGLAVPACVSEPVAVVPRKRKGKAGDETGEGSPGGKRRSRKGATGEPAGVEPAGGGKGKGRRADAASVDGKGGKVEAPGGGKGRKADAAPNGKGRKADGPTNGKDAASVDGKGGKADAPGGGKGGKADAPANGKGRRAGADAGGKAKPAEQAPTPKASTHLEPAPSGKPSSPAAPAADAPAYTIIDGRHTKHGHAIWTVQFRDRAPYDRFVELKRLADAAADRNSGISSGYYSSFKGNGAIPGYIFASEAEARRFVERALPAAAPTARPAASGRDTPPASQAARPAAAPAPPPTTERPTWPPAPEKAPARTRANLQAIRIAHTLQAHDTHPTPQERTTLLQYSGWGGLSIEKVQNDWPDPVPLPTSQSLVHEYYTPWQVCADITAAVERLLPGVAPIRALEPSAGVGRFIHTTAPERWRWTAIELSPLSALILSQSVPRGTTVVTSSFEAWVNSNAAQRFDAIVSNPPYGPRGESITADKDKRFRTRAAYEYFLLRAMTLLRPGGIAAFLIPGGFLTGPSKRPLRERIAESAAMLGAFRLPSGIFPGVRLTLDVVFLARREAEDYEPDDIFLDGRYFEAYPTHVLGELKASGRWGESEVIGDYTGLPAFEPRFTVAPPTPPALRVTRRPTAAEPPAAPTTTADPIRHRGFRSLWTLDLLVTDATGRDPFRSESFTAVPAAGWQAAVEDVVQSLRPKRDRLAWLRTVIATLDAATRKAQSHRDLTAQATLRDARAAVDHAVDAIKAQPNSRPLTTLGLPAPLARRLATLPIDDLIATPRWGTLIVERDATADWLPELEGLRILRVVAGTGGTVHIRLTDPGRETVQAARAAMARTLPIIGIPPELHRYAAYQHDTHGRVTVYTFASKSELKSRHDVMREQGAWGGAAAIGGIKRKTGWIEALDGIAAARRGATVVEVNPSWAGVPWTIATPAPQAPTPTRPATPAPTATPTPTATPAPTAAPASAPAARPSASTPSAAPASVPAARPAASAPADPPATLVIPDLVGVFAWRKGTTRVIPIDNRALDFESNVDGIMQRLASEGPGAWLLHSRATSAHPEAPIRAYALTVARRHDLDLEAITFDVVQTSPRRLPAFDVPPLPEPRLPAIGDRPRRSATEAHRRAARFMPRAGGNDALRSVWHTQGRAIAFDGNRLVEVPSTHTAPTRWHSRTGADVEEWPQGSVMVVVEALHHAAPAGDDVIAQADAEAFRAAVEPIGEAVLLRLRAGELYVESYDPDDAPLGRRLGPARGRDLIANLTRHYLWSALADATGEVTVRMSGRTPTHGIERLTGRLIIDRADGERHIMAPRAIDADAITRINARPLPTLSASVAPSNLAPGFTALEMEGGRPASAPAVTTLKVADPPMPSTLAPGFTALEMEDAPTPARKPPKASTAKPGAAALPAGLQAIEMERPTSAIAAAIERARAFTDPNDDILAGVRVGAGRVIASDGSRVIEISVDDTGPLRVLDADGQRVRADYPSLAELIPVADPLATLPNVRLEHIAAHLSYGPVRLRLDRRQLSIASDGDCAVIAGAIAERTSSDGEWTFDGRHLRDALAGAKGGAIRFGAGRSATVIERDDGERHLILPLDDDCEDCPVCITEVGDRPISPPEGPDETTLANLLAARVSAYERADARTRALLHPELASALDAFHAVFNRRLARLAPPLRVADEIAADATEARHLLREFPAGVPLSRVRNARELLTQGWRLDGDRLLPRDDYLSGNLWTRLDRLPAIPDAFADVEPGQRAELEAAIGEVSFAEINERISLRDGWVPLPVIAAFLVSLGRARDARITLVRRDGIVQLQDEGTSYDAITKAYDGRSPIRLVIGYINHDEKVFSPKKKQDEDINIVRREKADEFEAQFKAFLGAQPEHRDAIVEAYRRAHKGFLPRAYSGHPLELVRWGNTVTPHPHQNAGARRAVDQRGMVAAYGVGVGKTFTACATIALARQQLGTRRPVLLVPNSLVSKWQRDIAAALPDYAVVTIGEQATVGRDGKLRYGPDSKSDRETKWRRFREGLYDIALITVTAFLRTRIGADEFEALVANSPEVQRAVRLSQRNAAARTAGRRTERQQAVLEQGVRAWLAQMTEATHELDDIRWADLGADLLIVDEAQNYKGLHQPENREGGIPRFMGQSAPSKRAWGLDARARLVRARSGFIVLLSATPAKNSPLELYNLWSYVNGELWRDHGIHDPEAFISRFLELKPRLVIDSMMEASMRLAVTGFKHLDELKSILLRWGEFIQPADIGLTVPEPTTELVEVDLDAAQETKYATYVKAVEDEIDDMRKGLANGSRLLSLLGKMSLVAVHNMLDEGLDYDSAGAVAHHSPKFSAIADSIGRQRACGHIIFVQPIAAHRWLKETLIARGIPAHRIGVLNAVLATSSAARQRIADDFNAGRADVVIANSVAYEGLDLQQRTCAVHHADLPWEPATLNQRNGRAVRQGNELTTVAIRYYFARRSMDGLRFNIIQGKQGWLGALLEGSDGIANPGAQLEMGPEEVLLLISRTPEQTRQKLDALRAKAEAKRRRDEIERAQKLLANAAGQLAEARDAMTPERAERLRTGADAAFEALARIEADIWPWHALIDEARRRRADEILAREGCPPLFPGVWVRVDGRWHEVGRFGWDGTERALWVRRAGEASWRMHKADAVSGKTANDIAHRRPVDESDDWQRGVIGLVEATVYNPYRGWKSLGWNHAAPEWLIEAWGIAGATVVEQAGKVSASHYGTAPEMRFPYALNGEVYVHRRGGPPPAGAVLLPPTADGWQRWLTLASDADHDFELRDDTSRWWWGRGLRRGMQRVRSNPSRRRGRKPMAFGDKMKLPPHTAIGSYLLLGIDHADRLAWLSHEDSVRDAQTRQREAPADIPTVVIVKVENNARATPGTTSAALGGDPVFVDAIRLKQDAGVVIAADGADAIAMIIAGRNLDDAYRVNNRQVPAHMPRTVIGTVRFRYGSAR